MPLTTHTVTLDTNLPGPDGLPLEGVWTLSSPVLSDTANHAVLAGQRKVATTGGVAVLHLEETGQAGLEPPDAQYRLEFVSFDRKTTLGPFTFDVTGPMTIDVLGG